MPTATKKRPAKKSMSATTSTVHDQTANKATPSVKKLNFMKRITRRLDAFLARRPHRSFRRTYRRDYVRSLKLPGYWAFTSEVWRVLIQDWRTFSLLVLIYAIVSGVLVGMASQDTYAQLSDTLSLTGGALQENLGAVGKAGALFLAAITGGINGTPTEGQQIYGILIGLMTWLTTVWLLRNLLAGNNVRLRDGLYSSGSPIFSTFLVVLVIGLQLIPIVIAVIGYGAARSSGLLNGGVEAMLFWAAAILLAMLSLYWITSTIIALVVITLPGMYPWRAIRTAGDLVIGRRRRILLRLLWGVFVALMAWVIVMIPLILLNDWLSSVWLAVSAIPVVPVTLLLMSSLTVVWLASYVYLLYRKVVDDDAKPA